MRHNIHIFSLAFKQFEGHGVALLPYKLMYGAIQMVILGLCLNKFHGMGLLPLSPADWIDLIPHDIVKYFHLRVP